MEILSQLARFWKLTLLLHILLPIFGHPANVPLWRAKKLFLESTIDSESIVGGRNKRSHEDSSNTDSSALACEDPGIPANGTRVGNEFYVGRDLFFACKSGFVLRGSEVLTCRYGDDDEPYWDADLPQCVAQPTTHLGTTPPDPCGRPPEPSTFAIRLSYIIGVSVSYKCIDGYVPLVGQEQLTCRNGTWRGDLLQCRRIGECRDYGSIPNGERIIEGTREDNIVIFRCNEDFDLLGNQQLVCGSDGYWSAAWPVCRKSPVNCGDPGVLENGRRLVHGTTESSTVEYGCTDGYALMGTSERTCNSSGEWSGRLPRCQRVDCGPPESPAQGTTNYTATEYGVEAQYSCNTGCVLSGARTTVCTVDGTWSHPPPTCSIVQCSPLSSPVNGAVHMDGPMYSSTASYSCRQGYGLVGDATRTCQADGAWSGSTPRCKQGRCSTLEAPANGRVIINHHRPGGSARYSCNPGYVISGNLQRTCRLQGRWSGRQPTCEPVRCAILKAPRHGSVRLTNEDKFNSVATYSCDYGYELFGDNARFCQSTGMWTGKPPGCYVIECGELRAPHSGSVSFNGTTLWSEAVYRCDPGFVLRFGDEIRTCIRRGVWSGREPCCIREVVMCPSLMDPENGRVEFTTNVGDTATYTCDAEYILSGDSTRLCLPSGMWSGNEPACILGQLERPVCGSLSDPENGTVEIDSGFTTANYTCDEGFELVGVRFRTCMRDGNWSDSDPTCVLVDCGGLESPDNGTVDLSGGTTFGSTAVYSCDEVFELDGNSSRVCLSSGVWSNEAPVCYIIDCGNLKPPANGEVELSGTVFGSLANYSCDPSFRLIGSEIRICMENREWSPDAPICEQILCPILTPPENGQVFVNGQTVNSMATYFCEQGFVPELLERSCLDNGQWSDFDPMCIRNECDPNDLSDPENGMVSFDSITLGSIATYTCDQAFRLVGEPTRTCVRNGTSTVWSGQAPICESAFQCPELFDIPNGQVEFSSRTPGSTANYTCDFGFELQGDEQRVCMENETWSGQPPTCFQITCPDLPNPVNGIVDIQDNTPDGSAIYLCNPGLSLIGSSRRICNLDGTWSGEPPTCIELLCPVLTPPENGQVFVNGQTVNSIATYFCEDGFVPELLVRSCLDNGEWSGFDPMCIRNECDPNDLSDPENGMVSFESITLGSIATYTCDQAYRLVGEPTRTCVRNGANTVWSGQAPTCELILCPQLSLVNGMIIMTSDTVGSQAFHLCNAGFNLVGLSIRECTTSGQWSGAPPTCMPEAGTIACPALESPSDGNITISVTTPGSTVSYSCNLGYILAGPMTRTCLANGTWTGSDPMCNPVDCGMLVAPDNGRITMEPTPDSTTLNSITFYFCNEGFKIMGQSIRVCQQNGLWSGTAPTCQLVDCGPLENPINGLVDTSDGTTFGSAATYTCNLNFMINGTSTRFCTAEGVWGGQSPVCVAIMGNPDIDCGDPGRPPNGQRSLISTILNSVVNYTCNEAFMLVGNTSRICQSNEQWSGEVPSCVPIMCPFLPDPDNATIFVTGQAVGSQATYICISGFVVRPGDVIIRNCLPTGEWSGSEPQCIPDTSFMCPPLNDPVNGAVTVSGLNVGSAANFSCDLGYVLSGSLILQCGVRGIWSAPEPTCERILCPDPGVPSNGRRLGNDFRAGMIVFFSCNDGFEIEGEQLLQCLENGMWNNDTPTCVDIDRNTSSEGTVMDQFGRICNAVNGQLESCCRYRQDWSTLDNEEKSRYINAVKTVSSDRSFSQLYNELISRYRQSFTTNIQLLNASMSQFIPWHRYFLLEYENLLRLVDNDITIPYWDWTVRPNALYSLPVFDNTLGFGNSADETTFCVSSGPFREGQFEVTPSAGGGCLMREYTDSMLPPTRAVENNFLSLSVSMFDDFHNAIFQFVNVMVRCIVGGDMCSVDAANDPLYLLQLARVDLTVDRWQSMDQERAGVRYANDETPLDLTFDESLLVLNFSSNNNLPYGVCIRYSDLQEVEESTTESDITDPDDHSESESVETGSLQSEPQQQTSVPPKERRKRHPLVCTSEDQINKLGISEEERKSLLKLCGFSTG